MVNLGSNPSSTLYLFWVSSVAEQLHGKQQTRVQSSYLDPFYMQTPRGWVDSNTDISMASISYSNQQMKLYTAHNNEGSTPSVCTEASHLTLP